MSRKSCRFSVAWPGGGVICPSLAAKKRRAVYLFQRLSTPGHQPSGAQVWLAICNGGRLRTAAFAIVITFGMTTTMLGASSARAQGACPFPPAQALDEAHALLQQDNPGNDDLKTAIACLADIVADTREDLAALRDGRLAFTGQIHIPKGWTITKPSAGEAD